jgi:hypothetical protein
MRYPNPSRCQRAYVQQSRGLAMVSVVLMGDGVVRQGQRVQQAASLDGSVVLYFDSSAYGRIAADIARQQGWEVIEAVWDGKELAGCRVEISGRGWWEGTAAG